MSGKGTADMTQSIRRIREQLGWSDQDLASRIGASPDDVRTWETNRGTPPPERLAATYAAFYDAAMDELKRARAQF